MQVSALFHIASSKGPPPIPENISPECRDFLLLCFNRCCPSCPAAIGYAVCYSYRMLLHALCPHARAACCHMIECFAPNRRAWRQVSKVQHGSTQQRQMRQKVIVLCRVPKERPNATRLLQHPFLAGVGHKAAPPHGALTLNTAIPPRVRHSPDQDCHRCDLLCAHTSFWSHHASCFVFSNATS